MAHSTHPSDKAVAREETKSTIASPRAPSTTSNEHATWGEFLLVLFDISFWQMICFKSSNNRLSMFFGVVSRLFFLASVVTASMSTKFVDVLKEYPNLSIVYLSILFVVLGVLFSLVNVVVRWEKILKDEKNKLGDRWEESMSRRLRVFKQSGLTWYKIFLKIAFPVAAAYMALLLERNDGMALISIGLFTGSIVFFELEYQAINDQGLFDGVLLIGGAMFMGHFKDDDHTFVKTSAFWLILATMTLRHFGHKFISEPSQPNTPDIENPKVHDEDQHVSPPRHDIDAHTPDIENLKVHDEDQHAPSLPRHDDTDAHFDDTDSSESSCGLDHSRNTIRQLRENPNAFYIENPPVDEDQHVPRLISPPRHDTVAQNDDKDSSVDDSEGSFGLNHDRNRIRLNMLNGQLGDAHFGADAHFAEEGDDIEEEEDFSDFNGDESDGNTGLNQFEVPVGVVTEAPAEVEVDDTVIPADGVTVTEAPAELAVDDTVIPADGVTATEAPAEVAVDDTVIPADGVTATEDGEDIETERDASSWLVIRWMVSTVYGIETEQADGEDIETERDASSWLVKVDDVFGVWH